MRVLESIFIHEIVCFIFNKNSVNDKLFDTYYYGNDICIFFV